MTEVLIKALQTEINSVCSTDLEVDGEYGALTHRAILAALAELSGDKHQMPPWLVAMSRNLNLHEVRDERRLINWLSFGLYLGNPRELPWCGDAVETAFATTLPDEVLPKSPFWAQSWAQFGKELENPAVGSVGVIRWNKNAGHVGFVIDWTNDQICLRGGNQANAINDCWFKRNKFIAFRWPQTFPFQTFPKIRTVQAGSANHNSTR